MQAGEIVAESWYPSGIATGLASIEGGPSGFATYRLSTRWGSFDLLAPLGSPTDGDWWSQITSDEGWWGEIPDLTNCEISPLSGIPSIGDGWAWSVKLRGEGGGELEIRCLPADEHGNGRALAELDCPYLLSALGGLQYAGQDVLIITPAPRGVSAVEAITELVATKDAAGLNALAEQIGTSLGGFAAAAGAVQHLPFTQRIWNDRLKQIEGWTKAKTLWRAPHAPESNGTLTHRNMGLPIIHIEGNDIRFSGCYDGVVNAILKPAKTNPALRDVAALFTSLGQHLASLSAEHYEEGMRAAILAGWSSSAPPRWSARRALDTHLGGIAIWEYEQHLEALAWAQVTDGKVPAYSQNCLNRVSRLQAEMFVNRIWSVAGLAAFVVGAWFSFSFLFSGHNPYDLVVAIPATLAGWLFKSRYHSSARPPERPI